MNLLKTTIAALVLALPLATFAQSAHGNRTPRIDQQQTSQAKRIQQGVRSGSLTPREAASLERELRHLRMMEYRAKADGKVTRSERAQLLRAENRLNRHIYIQKHDRQQSFSRHYPATYRHYAYM